MKVSRFGQYSRVAGSSFLYEENRGRVFLAGDGPEGAKAGGLVDLNAIGENVKRCVGFREDFFRRYSISDVIDTVRVLHFIPQLAIRSSAQVEDQLGRPAAGIFESKLGVYPLDTEDGKRRFVRDFEFVKSSAYTEKAERFWQAAGYTAIPPLPVIVQEVEGKQWEHAPGYFFPALSGIANTSFYSQIRVAMVFGLGHAAVKKGWGVLWKFDREGGGPMPSGADNDIVWVLNREEEELLTKGEVSTLVWSMKRGKLELVETVKRVFQAAQRVEGCFGHSVDIEWASSEGKEIALLQARPVRKRTPVPKPEVKNENIIVQSTEVLGWGEKKGIKQIIYICCDYSGPFLEKRVVAILKKYPESVVVWRTNVIEDMREEILEYAFSYTDTLIIDDINDVHGYGFSSDAPKTGLGHTMLGLIEEGKILIMIEQDDTKGFSVEKFNGLPQIESLSIQREDKDLIQVQVYAVPGSLRVAADDEAGWGMVYLDD